MVVITSPTPMVNEASLINKMFEKGLSLLHVRKPNMDINELRLWVKNIDNCYHQSLVIHIPNIVINNKEWFFEQYIALINNLNSTYTHLSTDNCSFVNNYKYKLPKLSTSVHCITEVNKLSTTIERVFISPIYPSISKKGYSSSINWTEEIRLRTNFNTTLVALGGITPYRIKELKTMGFDDYALLGTIWEADQPLKQFELCQHYDQLHWQ
ncbi:thiamine phosphate synthase [Myroides marinus]|uniref:Thiamine-phosphate pyrophosphorylase n=1 Tax=Myroides marinus TaxID=703342 RepID=A0A1H6RFF3_9FLAO|nr:thiamine phosphate synthase [Myroides marinus]MDM1345509.1 thiamine phosphate synthase [Myroides marinus]MDM1349098.1 thiamine phosphate synthase [Myroides marinus]MDM1352744.1 thiamine phosphate synthase [Myroides marinus]MDM1356308.1 thiamine phosphate synthase [Myroides marinus]MDM1360028.1 thiamine phosphate synthase [Myroides marinus]